MALQIENQYQKGSGLVITKQKDGRKGQKESDRGIAWVASGCSLVPWLVFHTAALPPPLCVASSNLNVLQDLYASLYCRSAQAVASPQVWESQEQV